MKLEKQFRVDKTLIQDPHHPIDRNYLIVLEYKVNQSDIVLFLHSPHRDNMIVFSFLFVEYFLFPTFIFVSIKNDQVAYSFRVTFNFKLNNNTLIAKFNKQINAFFTQGIFPMDFSSAINNTL